MWLVFDVLVTWSESVAVSAPPVLGTLQPLRPKRRKEYWFLLF